ncbi:MAG: ATP-dependent DNA helicase [Alphaproteobacteria bacterium]|nr:ATP-dependent DNA helicase [Alphaproteobacteria bacterium]
MDDRAPDQHRLAVERSGPPAIVAGHDAAVVLEPGGVPRRMTRAAAAERAKVAVPVVCHRPSLARRLGLTPFAAHDVLELYAFVHPARAAIPTPNGLARALGLAPAADLEGEAALLVAVADRLLARLAERAPDPDIAGIATTMAAAGWPWGPSVLAALAAMRRDGGAGLAVWRNLPEWAEHAPEPPPGNVPVDPAEARRRLALLIGPDAEPRPQQGDYASAVSFAFQPRDAANAPTLVLAEAGTGVGKTLGYIAPASVWAEKNEGAVWLSTYTRNLQRQIDGELDKLYPDAEVKARKVIVRKGRENYLCLLSFEEAVASTRLRAQDTIALGLVARWARASRDGDIAGGDFPGWLPDLVGTRATIGLTDRRGECIYSACAHYHRCFIERTVRRARRAEIVVANHALVMAQVALGGIDDANVPTRLVFDEGHHVFDAADQAFASHLTGLEAAELRHWLIGAEEGRRSRARGLRRRILDFAEADGAVAEALETALGHARVLPAPGWLQRIAGGGPQGSAERFLAGVRQQVHARAREAAAYDLETEARPPVEGVLDDARALAAALERLAAALHALVARLGAYRDREAETLDTAARNRIEAAQRGIARRADGALAAWGAMLASLPGAEPETFVDWFAIARAGGRETDVGMHRHWIDPTIPFAKAVIAPAHGVVLTSATLRDGTGDTETDWRAAEARTGARHLATPARRAQTASPFDYAMRTRVFIVTDVGKADAAAVAAAYRALFLAAGGGALGLFTSIARLRAVHTHIAAALEADGIRLLAQHVDSMDTASLVDIFRAEEETCLLGTDAVRDGIDVSGRALRLLVFDRVPWPRPTILHRARRKAFADTDHDDMITRLRLKQAYGRLIRRADDIGVFVMLDPALPSRLLGAFPPGVPVARVGLADAVAATRDFLARPGAQA